MDETEPSAPLASSESDPPDTLTGPEKALGLDTPEGVAMWDQAEKDLAEAMDEFQGVGTWRDNPGDGAFYGPKIDIKVYDAQHRSHQCATGAYLIQIAIRSALHRHPRVGKRIDRNTG